MLTVDTLSCEPIRTRLALEMFHCCSSSARYILSSSAESSKIVVVLPSAATDKVLYAHCNKRYTSYHSVIRFQRWSSPALHPTSSHLFICRPGVQAAHHVYQRDRMSDVHPGWAVRVDRTANDLYSRSPAAAVLWIPWDCLSFRLTKGVNNVQ